MNNQSKKPYSPMKISPLGSFQNLTQAGIPSVYGDAMNMGMGAVMSMGMGPG